MYVQEVGWVCPEGVHEMLPTPMKGVTDRRLWKHYLRATTVAGGKYVLLLQKERLLPELVSFGCDVSPNDVQYAEKDVYKQKRRT